MLAVLFPGQGSQTIGMGAELFAAYPDLVAEADAILGYSIEELCLRDPNKVLGQTQFTQPALYVVGCLSELKRRESGAKASYYAGHSLGEFCALWAAGVFDFATGLKMVQKRGQLMAAASEGGMAAILGITAVDVEHILAQHGAGVTIANYNSGQQTVISGAKADVDSLKEAFAAQKGARFMPLNVSGAFHSVLMKDAQRDFAAFIAPLTFNDLVTPVIANVTAKPYTTSLKETLAAQLASSVRWEQSMRYLLEQGVTEFVEAGPGKVLTNLLARIKA